MGKGRSPLGGSGGGGSQFNPGGYTGADRDFVVATAKDYNSGELYGGDMQGVVEAYAMTHKGINDNDMIEAIRTEAAIQGFKGNSTMGASVSGKAYDANDYKTWRVGDNVNYTVTGEGRPITYEGKVTAVKSSNGNVLVRANGMNLIIDKDTKSMFRAKK